MNNRIYINTFLKTELIMFIHIIKIDLNFEQDIHTYYNKNRFVFGVIYIYKKRLSILFSNTEIHSKSENNSLSYSIIY